MKLPLFSDDMILYLENSRLHQKIARTDTQIQWSHRIKKQCTEIYYILYTDHEAAEREIKKTISFIIVTNIRHLGINLIKEMKNLYSENYKTWMEKIEDDTCVNGKISHAHGL